MNRLWIIATLAAAVALAGCGSRPAQPPANKRAPTGDTRADIRTFIDDYKDALNKSDSTQVLSMYAEGAEVTLAGKGQVLRGRDAVRKSAEETIFNPEQNVFSVDSLDVLPLGPDHAMALVVYKIEPPDEDLATFHTVVTYLLAKSRIGWQIIHAHVSSDWVMD